MWNRRRAENGEFSSFVSWLTDSIIDLLHDTGHLC